MSAACDDTSTVAVAAWILVAALLAVHFALTYFV